MAGLSWRQPAARSGARPYERHGSTRLHFPESVVIREVGPRDGLQNEDPVPTEGKIRLIDALSGTGLSQIETVSFVRPDAIPQMGDADEVWAKIDKNPGVTYSGLVLNLRGAERAIAAGVDLIQFAMSSSETHNTKNAGRSVGRSLADLRAVVEAAGAAEIPVHGTISTIWGCPYEGELTIDQVFAAVDGAIETGVSGVSLGDTTGMGTPARVGETVSEFRRRHGETVSLNLHLHNTRGTGLANVIAAMDAGCTYFDASVGGLGGCPYAPGATGNICTEDLVHMLDDMKIATGVSLDRLLEAAAIAQELVGHELPSQVLKAGPRTRTTAA